MALFEGLGFIRFDQLPCPNNHAHPAAVGLPTLPVVRLVADGKKALHENRMNVSNILGPNEVAIYKGFDRGWLFLLLFLDHRTKASENLPRALHVFASLIEWHE
jgi:hypothetical protein